MRANLIPQRPCRDQFELSLANEDPFKRWKCFSLSERQTVSTAQSHGELRKHGRIRKPLFLRVIAHRSGVIGKNLRNCLQFNQCYS